MEGLDQQPATRPQGGSVALQPGQHLRLLLDWKLEALVKRVRESAAWAQADLALAKCGRTLYFKFNSLAKKKRARACPCVLAQFWRHAFVSTHSSRLQNVERKRPLRRNRQGDGTAIAATQPGSRQAVGAAGDGTRVALYVSSARQQKAVGAGG